MRWCLCQFTSQAVLTSRFRKLNNFLMVDEFLHRSVMMHATMLQLFKQFCRCIKTFFKKALFKDFLQWIFGKQLTTYSSIPGVATFSITGYYDLPHAYFSSYQVIPMIRSCKARLLRIPSTTSREAVDHLLQHTWRCYIHHQRISRSSPWLFAFIPRHTKNKKLSKFIF